MYSTACEKLKSCICGYSLNSFWQQLQQRMIFSTTSAHTWVITKCTETTLKRFTTLQGIQSVQANVLPTYEAQAAVCAAVTFHVKLPADEVLHISHEGSHFGAVVGVVGQVAPNELLLGGGLVQHDQVHHLCTLWLDGGTHLHPSHQQSYHTFVAPQAASRSD